MKKLFLSAAALVVLLAACSKDDDNTPQTNGKYLAGILSENDSLIISYDDSNRMKKLVFWYRESPGEGDSSELVYENGKLTKTMEADQTGVLKLSETYEYNSAGKLVKKNAYSSYDGEKNNYDSLVYNADGRLISLYEAGKSNDVFTYFRKYNYSWDNKGNIVSSVRIRIEGGTETKDSTFVTYTYDSKVNFASKQPEFFLTEPEDPIFGLSANNVIKSVETSNNGQSYVMTVTNEYTYDEDGYPVTRKEVEKTTQGETVVHTNEDTFRYSYIKK